MTQNKATATLAVIVVVASLMVGATIAIALISEESRRLVQLYIYRCVLESLLMQADHILVADQDNLF
jgi:hypothetical protein